MVRMRCCLQQFCMSSVLYALSNVTRVCSLRSLHPYEGLHLHTYSSMHAPSSICFLFMKDSAQTCFTFSSAHGIFTRIYEIGEIRVEEVRILSTILLSLSADIRMAAVYSHANTLCRYTQSNQLIFYRTNGGAVCHWERSQAWRQRGFFQSKLQEQRGPRRCYRSNLVANPESLFGSLGSKVGKVEVVLQLPTYLPALHVSPSSELKAPCDIDSAGKS